MGHGALGIGEPVRCGGSLRCSTWRHWEETCQIILLTLPTLPTPPTLLDAMNRVSTLLPTLPTLLDAMNRVSTLLPTLPTIPYASRY
ncbi:hypothetical protein B4U84_21740 [Westiellopsis prolifica IICB1]|nr:hypothetical protein B4U84_21740 [Westiellopsis prolifica IICB1]